MFLLLFLIKITLGRIIDFARHYPVIVIGTAIIIFSFAVSELNAAINLDTNKCIMVLTVLVSAALFVSLRNYNTTHDLVVFSKGNLTNKTIAMLFFMKMSIRNNVFLLLFNLIALKGLVRLEHPVHVPIITVFSLLCSFALMNIKSRLKSISGFQKSGIPETPPVDKKAGGGETYKRHINPLVKSTVYDYFTSDFFQGAVISIFLFVVVLLELLKSKDILKELDKSSVAFMGLVAALSFGFMGITDSIAHTNWKYYAAVSPHGFGHHFKRALAFLTVFFGLFMAVFIAAASSFGVPAMLKYLYCIIILMLFSVNTAFTAGSVFIKALGLITGTALTVWLGVLYAHLLPILTIPALVTLLKAKIEYKEWYLLWMKRNSCHAGEKCPLSPPAIICIQN
ncbi:MAG: hypothetical protein LBF63_09680 [Treponema sp.]|jgi:hypothetical protein|nr:hypothetical protein [Treponema sp.]